jgi:hypothetical protein
MSPHLPSNLSQRAAATRSLTPLARLFLFIAAVGLILAPVANFGVSGVAHSFVIAAGMIFASALWRRQISIFELLMIIGCLAVPFSGVPLSTIRQPDRTQRYTSMQSLYFAMKQYAQKHGQALPSAYVTNSAGMHSWRVSLLPHIGERALFADYNFNEAWDSPNNHKLAALELLVYHSH